MVEIFNSITNIAKKIENDVFVNFANFDQNNSLQEIQKNILEHCSNIIEDEFKQSKSIKALISKDKKEFHTRNNENGKYLISYVSIDNIELIDLNFSLGTIFGIYEENFEAENLKAVVYITYGPTFQVVFASQAEGVKYFSFENNEFIQQDSLSLNERGKINSTAGKRSEFSKKHIELLDNFFNDGYRLRFSNSLVLDTHQILFKKGGLYSAPVTASNPNGSISVIFEAFPIAFIIELANGKAINGQQRILDIKSPSIDQKTPIYFGSTTEITKVKEFFS